MLSKTNYSKIVDSKNDQKIALTLTNIRRSVNKKFLNLSSALKRL